MRWRSGITDQLWLSLLCVMDVVLLPVSLAHALKCRKGGLVIIGGTFNALGEMMAMAFGNQIVKEPIVREADPESSEGAGLVAVGGFVAFAGIIRYSCR